MSLVRRLGDSSAPDVLVRSVKANIECRAPARSDVSENETRMDVNF